jgi:hypothetical protein
MRLGSTTSLLNQKEQVNSGNTPIIHPQNKRKTILSAGIIIAIVFWDSKDILHLHFLAGQKTIKAQYYSTLLNEKVKPEICSKRRKRQDSVCLCQDKDHPHNAALTMATVLKVKWDVLLHPAYSPDLAPSYYNLFGPMKGILGCKIQE